MYEKQCEADFATSTLVQANLIEHSVLILQGLVDYVKDHLEQLGVALVHAAV